MAWDCEISLDGTEQKIYNKGQLRRVAALFVLERQPQQVTDLFFCQQISTAIEYLKFIP